MIKSSGCSKTERLRVIVSNAIKKVLMQPACVIGNYEDLRSKKRFLFEGKNTKHK